MAAPYNPPTKGEDFIIYIGLEDLNTPGSFLSDPTIAAADFQVSKDGGSLANLATTPSVAPASSVMVKLTLSATEMNADVVTIVGIDQSSPKLWADVLISIPTTAA